MARNDISNPLGVMNAKKGSRAGSATHGNAALVYTNGADVNTLRTRLKAISATTYTDKVLDDMTKNDMLYAIRVNDDSANIR